MEHFASVQPKIQLDLYVNMSWTIVLFIESSAFDIQLTTSEGGASTNEIKPRLDSLNSVRHAIASIIHTDKHIHYFTSSYLPKIVITEKPLRDCSVHAILLFEK